MGRAIVITSGKGGVGKSTLCANLALALIERGQKVLVVDADTGLRNLDLLMGLQDRIVYDLTDAAQGVCRLKQAIVKSREVEGLHLIAAAQNRDCASVTPGQMKALVKKLTALYDIVLVDCPAGLDRGFATAVSGAQEAIVVLLDEMACVRGAERLLGILKKEADIPCQLVVNRMRFQKGEHSTDRANELAKGLEIPLLGVIAEDEEVLSCAREGKLAAEEEDAPFAGAVRRIAGRLLGEKSEILPVARKRLWARIMGR